MVFQQSIEYEKEIISLLFKEHNYCLRKSVGEKLRCERYLLDTCM